MLENSGFSQNTIATYFPGEEQHPMKENDKKQGSRFDLLY